MTSNSAAMASHSAAMASNSAAMASNSAAMASNSAARASSLQNRPISIPRLNPNNKPNNLPRMIVFALRYFGCTHGRILAMIHFYGFPQATQDSVVAFIKHAHTIAHFEELSHPAQGPVFHTAHVGSIPTTVAIEYDDRLPVTLEIRSSSLPSWSPRKAPFVQAPDGRRIFMEIGPGYVLCRVHRLGTETRTSLAPYLGPRTPQS